MKIQRKIKKDEYYLLKHKGKLLFKDSLSIEDKYKYNNHFHQMKSESNLLNMMLSIDSTLKEAYELKEEYAIFSNLNSPKKQTKEDLLVIIASFKNSNLPSFQTFGETMEDWADEIINTFDTYDDKRINNSVIEGRNKYVSTKYTLANGYTNFKRFRNRIIYSLYKLEVPAKEPKDTRLLKLTGENRGSYKKK